VMKKQTLGAALAAGLVVVMLIGVTATPAASHHSFSMYDQDVSKTLTGQLTRFILGANHAQIIFELLDPDGAPVMENGQPVIWGVETGSAASLARRGITVETFQFGTIISVTLNPLRDGRNFGAMTNTAGEIVKCGMTMPDGGCTEETGEVFMRN
jgi:hypothetical protein